MQAKMDQCISSGTSHVSLVTLHKKTNKVVMNVLSTPTNHRISTVMPWSEPITFIMRTETLEELLIEGLSRNNTEQNTQTLECETNSPRDSNDSITGTEDKIVKKKRSRQVFKRKSETIENIKALEEYISKKWGRRDSLGNPSKTTQ